LLSLTLTSSIRCICDGGGGTANRAILTQAQSGSFAMAYDATKSFVASDGDSNHATSRSWNGTVTMDTNDAFGLLETMTIATPGADASA
jgi:hypothetical protein